MENIYSIQFCMRQYVLLGAYLGLSTFLHLDCYVVEHFHRQMRDLACKIKTSLGLCPQGTKGQVNMLKCV